MTHSLERGGERHGCCQSLSAVSVVAFSFQVSVSMQLLPVVIAFLSVVSLIGSLGCDSTRQATFPVVGTVHLADGRVVEQGMVEFRLDLGEQRIIARGKIQPDGTFALSTFRPSDGALPGQHQVIVQQLIVAEGFAADHQHGPRIAARYADYATSGLQAVVEAIGSNRVDLTLQP